MTGTMDPDQTLEDQAPAAERKPKLDFGFVLSAKWLGGLAFCLLFAFACALLGQWQMDRRMEAVAEINKVLENYDEPAVPYSEAQDLFTDFQPQDEWTPVVLQGEYLEQDTRIVRNRPLNGRPGYEALVPFRTDTGEVIVVNRGWLPIGNSPGRPDTVPAPPSGPAEVTVRVKPGEPTLDRDAPEGQLASIDLVAFEESVGYPVARAAYGLRAVEDPAPATSPQLPAKPPLDEGPHLSYSLQWFMFGLMSFVVWGYLVRQKAVNDREDRIHGFTEEDGYLSAHRPERAKPVRRRGGQLTDEEIEDALVDAGESR